MSAQKRQDLHRNAAHEAAQALHAGRAPHALQRGGHAAAVVNGTAAQMPTGRTLLAGAVS
ncbi:hypothetical protein [Paraburkholderia tagetis]|uniref:Uncharacterized protein n=1 Tax=Paraburkholderia tagetis TaxID=2913261 RepID=A0A9X1UII8_9BURK|nr:hypothetical protein [Paraburkholderia tagetis]MCG5074962.1 hypothetical protein [Paraburkholderia tagetis]